MLPLLISFVWGFKIKLPIFDPGVKIKKIYQGCLANTHKCSEQNFEIRTASSLGAVMSFVVHKFSPKVLLQIWSCTVKKTPIDILTAVDESRLL